jgi:hypothetical protein
MKFKIITTHFFYQNRNRRNQLEELGFEFYRSKDGYYLIQGVPSIEINTLEELIQFIKEYECDRCEIIISDEYIKIRDEDAE